MKHAPYWWEEAELNLPEVDMPKSADVAIVGAGYTGLSAALVLARAGVSVVVFEAGALGEGASSRNGGMVGPSFHKIGVAGLKAKFGEDTATGILRESLGFVDYIEGFLAREQIDAGFKRTGRFLGAVKPKHLERLEGMLESLSQSTGIEGRIIRQQDVHSEIGSDMFCGGLAFDIDGGLHPAKYLAGLAQKVVEAGAVILPHTPVDSVAKHGSNYRLSTAKGSVAAQKVAICTNGYTGKQFGDFKRRILPLRSAIITTEEIAPERMARLFPNGRMHGDSRRIFAYYRPTPDGKRVLFGSRATGLKDNPVGNAKQLRTSMLEVFPELADTGISHVWSGLVGYAFDHAPHIGQRGGLHYAMGYCGSGVSRASYFGNKLGYKILGEADKGRTAFDSLAFETKPFYSGNPWFMPAVLEWHRMLDRFGL